MKRILCVMDLDHTLMYIRRRTVRRRSFLKNQDIGKPDLVQGNREIFFRPGREELLDIFFDDVFSAIWSSTSNEVTKMAAEAYFGPHFKKLLFVNGTNRSVGNKRMDDLGVLFDFFEDYDETNTLMVAPYANANDQFATNDLIMSPYSPELNNMRFNQDLEGISLAKYLIGLKTQVQTRNLEDIRSILMTRRLSDMSERLEISRDGVNF